MSLLFNVSQLLKAEVGQSRTYEFRSPDPLDLDDTLATDVHGNVKFMLTNFGVIASVHAEACLELTCARCLEPCSSAIRADFEEEYRPLIDIATGLPAKLPPSDDVFEISANHMIDLGEAIRQQLLLSVELIPVCKPQCRGLCPNCGVNLNLESCNCPRTDTSNPFAVLQGLFAESEIDR